MLQNIVAILYIVRFCNICTIVTEFENILQQSSDRSLIRASELRKAGISGTAISRAVERGLLLRIGRGLYQRPDADIPENIQLAEAAKLHPSLRIGFVSALAFHDVTDEMPRQVWGAIKHGAWKPSSSYPKVKAVRVSEFHYSEHVERHQIAGVSVPIFSLPKTLADCFRLPRVVTRSVAIEALGRTIRNKKSTPSEISMVARNHGAWAVMRPYLEFLTING